MVNIHVALPKRLLDCRPNYALSVLVASCLVGQTCAKTAYLCFSDLQIVSVKAILDIGVLAEVCHLAATAEAGKHI